MLLELINKKIESRLSVKLELIVSELQKELVTQGHVLTGALRDSIRYEVKQLPNIVEGLVFMLEYGEAIDQGIQPSKIPYSGNGKGGTSEYIQGLIRFFVLKGLPREEAKSAAFATANKHRQTGFPTPNSFRFSSNGKRTGFFSDTIEKLEGEILSVRDGISNDVTLAIGNLIENRVKEFDSILIAA